MMGILCMGGASLALMLASCAWLLVRGGNLGDFLDDSSQSGEDGQARPDMVSGVCIVRNGPCGR